MDMTPAEEEKNAIREGNIERMSDAAAAAASFDILCVEKERCPRMMKTTKEKKKKSSRKKIRPKNERRLYGHAHTAMLLL